VGNLMVLDWMVSVSVPFVEYGGCKLLLVISLQSFREVKLRGDVWAQEVLLVID
jgi:hypothetical protein